MKPWLEIRVRPNRTLLGIANIIRVGGRLGIHRIAQRYRRVDAKDYRIGIVVVVVIVVEWKFIVFESNVKARDRLGRVLAGIGGIRRFENRASDQDANLRVFVQQPANYRLIG